MNASDLDELVAEREYVDRLGLFGDQPFVPSGSPQTWAKAARAAGRAWKAAHQDHYGALERLQAPIERLKESLNARVLDPEVGDAEVVALRGELLRAMGTAGDLERALNSRLEAFMRRWREENPEPKPVPETPRAAQAS